MDSATCLFLMKKKGYRSRALTMKYHGIAGSELRAAESIAEKGEAYEHRMVELPDLKEAADLGERLSEMPSTFIPMRNAIFYSVAAGYAIEVGSDYIVGGHNRDDVGVFEDTGRAFFSELQKAFWIGSKLLKDRRTTILRPLQHMSKQEVIVQASRLRVPLELTWSCHRDGNNHCWKCAGCANRVSAFDATGVVDPLRHPP
ncbi:MAG: 7-cyano-7-deazaguanine synthase [Thaumarchaeota archaeon]|nr:7-cyano-7-deazaguanine synthase [Nitrososphaerota archaeon]